MYHTPMKRVTSTTNEMAFHTPMNFRKELKQVLNERNLLTAKTRRKVCSMLDKMTPERPNEEMDKRKSFRLQAIQEIVSSEKTYLKQLEILMKYFVIPLKEQAIINDTSHTTLFGQIEMIYNLNGELLKEIELNLENVAQAFLKMAPFFKLYSVYAFDYRNALFIVQDLISKNPVFRKFLENTECRPEVQRKLNSLMIVPIQRVPRYKLLLEQVLLYTSPADTDFKLLKESVKQVENTVSHINSVIEDQEVTQMLLNLQNSLVNRTPNIVKPSRKVIKEGILNKVTRNGSEIKRYCVLMSDIFMYCKVIKDRQPNIVVENSLECCCIFPLKKCKVYEMFPGNFKITCHGDGIILCTKDLQVGRTWVGFIKDAIDLHIQCRKTLRKESSKKTPLRKKDIKNFDTDYVISPNKRKCDYETIFRNTNRCTDSEDDEKDGETSCFPHAKQYFSTASSAKNIAKKKCAAVMLPPLAPPPKCLTSSVHTSANRIFKVRKYKSSDKNRIGGILKNGKSSSGKQTASADYEHDPTYGFANRFSDSKSYFRTHNVDNTIPTTVNRSDLFNESIEGNLKDILYPLRTSGGSNKSGGWSKSGGKENARPPDVLNEVVPLKKRVKFDDSQDSYYSDETDNRLSAPYNFSSELAKNTSLSLKKRIVDFFTQLF